MIIRYLRNRHKPYILTIPSVTFLTRHCRCQLSVATVSVNATVSVATVSIATVSVATVSVATVSVATVSVATVSVAMCPLPGNPGYTFAPCFPSA